MHERWKKPRGFCTKKLSHHFGDHDNFGTQLLRNGTGVGQSDVIDD